MLVHHAFRNVIRSPIRSTVTLLGVATLLFLVSLLVSILGGFAASTETDTTHLRLITRHQVSLMFTMPEAYWDRIRHVPHVQEVAPANWFGGTYIDRRNFFSRFFVDPDTFLRVTPEIAIPPEQVAEWKADRRGALASEELADRFGWKVGDPITLVGDIYPMTAELILRAVYTGGEEALYFQRDYVEEALSRPGQVGTYTVQVDSTENLSSVAGAVDALFTDSDAPTKTETEKAFQASFVSMVGNVKGLVANLTLIIAVTILLTTGNTMAMAVRERTTEIAILKALGFPPRRIVALVVTESVLLVGFAGLLGVGGFWLLSYLVFVVGKVKIPMVWFPLTLPTGLGLATCAGVLAVGVVAGLVPALVAARRSVVDGLRRT